MEEERITYSSKTAKESQIRNAVNATMWDNSSENIEKKETERQSKTVVYPVDGEKKESCSFKGYKSIWQPFKEAVWDDGFPDICYVEHIFHSAYLSAKREKSGRIDIPFTIRNNNFYITIHAPYIVKRPRRKIAYRKEEFIEEEAAEDSYLKWDRKVLKKGQEDSR